MSGGVDSSVAALLLKKQGYNVVGVFMRCYNLDGCAEQDAEDARRVAEHLEIPFYVWDFEEEYKRRVVEYMIEGYRSGITPNPDVMCNKEIKFGLFFKRAIASGADFVATGHYVSLRPLARTAVRSLQRRAPAASRSDESRKAGHQAHRNSESFSQEDLVQFGLFEAKDKNKDQSYFLWTLTQKQLQYCLFPIGEYLKPDVRAIARKAGLPTAEKKDSQGICLLGKVSAADFLKQYIPEKRGAVLNVAGEKIGEHRGAAFYTIGQRHINIENPKSEIRNPKRGPTYVSEKNVRTNTLVVAEGSKNEALYRKEIKLANVNFITPQLHHPYKLENVRMFVRARVRYRQPLTRATLLFSYSRELEKRNFHTDQKSRISCKLVFKTPQKFVAPGQSAVLYSQKSEMLGGGVIA